MRGWFCEWDPLNFTIETIIPEAWSITDTVERILANLFQVLTEHAGLAGWDAYHRPLSNARLQSARRRL